ncbi:MAG: hypothetical protein KKF89_00205, partial [Nanoarchaeota archaeon]|nr:hypothetical protein [Nanoarchaeota archaeon]
WLSKEFEDSEKASFEDLKKKKESFVEQRIKIFENLEKINSRESTFIAMKSNSNEIIDKISRLDNCPVCLQTVNDSHKKKVTEKENLKIVNIEEQVAKLSELKRQRKEELKVLDDEIKVLDESINQQKVLLVRKEQLHQYKEKKEKLMKEQLRLEKEQSDIVKESQELTNLLNSKKGLQEKYSEAKQLLDNIKEKLKVEEIKKAEKIREKKVLEEVMQKLIVEIANKEASKKELSFVNELTTWLMKFFLNLIYLMEKQIMLSIHQEFNEHFQDWFNILIEDENLNVRLDETFSPIIEQNGYETYMVNLSGGEKTSVALAYRLALNKVINEFIGLVKTKDLLILDEPTDGFSSEQLDKIRDLLEQLRIKQIILVSHEPKLESYVDHIIRVHKEGHITRIIT